MHLKLLLDMHSKLLAIFFVMTSIIANAQTTAQQLEVKDILESVAENLPDDYDITELIDILVRYKKHPVNLNKTTPEELRTFVFLSPLQISNFFSRIKESGDLNNVLELQSIDGFDLKTVQSLLPFVALTEDTEYEKLTLQNILRLGENDLMLRFSQTLQKQKGFTDLPGNRYLGSPERFQTRYSYNYGTIVSASITLDKDAGEKFIDKPNLKSIS